MLKKRNTGYYAAKIAKMHGLPEKAAKNVLIGMMKNVCRVIVKGEDIAIPKFGSIQFNKPLYIKRIKTNQRNVNSKKKPGSA